MLNQIRFQALSDSVYDLPFLLQNALKHVQYHCVDIREQRQGVASDIQQVYSLGQIFPPRAHHSDSRASTGISCEL